MPSTNSAIRLNGNKMLDKKKWLKKRTFENYESMQTFKVYYECLSMNEINKSSFLVVQQILMNVHRHHVLMVVLVLI